MTRVNLPILGDSDHPQSVELDGPAIAMSAIHDFSSKLRQPQVLAQLRAYVEWQKERRDARAAGADLTDDQVPAYAPVSINLDITTACNFACDHCVDMDILNTGIKYDHQRLLDSLKLMAENGLKSVIVIGGGEPTVYPKFAETIRFMKSLGLQVSIVSNGSGNHRILDCADAMDANDWVRLSLDSATDPTFQAMHKPKKTITLDKICEGVPPIRERNGDLVVGFSFIVTWRGAFMNNANIVENMHEIYDAAVRARKYRFSYIAFKPFLTRALQNNAEIVGIKHAEEEFGKVIGRINAEVERARELETEDFKVYQATNLKALVAGKSEKLGDQPHECHMQFFRQVLSPLGMYHCPVYRNQPQGKVGGNEAYATEKSFDATRRNTSERISNFDAAHECREVTCLYNQTNWWIEDLIAHPQKLDALEPVAMQPADFFL